MQAAIPLMVASAVVSAGTTLVAGAQNKATYKAKAAERQRQGVAERDRIRDVARTQMGRQVAQQAASGFQPGTGSFAGELEESLIDRELDLLTSRRNASAEAAGLKRAGHYAMTNAAFGAVGALLNGGANVAGHNAGMQAAGG